MINLNKSYIAFFSNSMIICLRNEKHLKLIMDLQFNNLYFAFMNQKGLNN